jgi:hypothetical protein
MKSVITFAALVVAAFSVAPSYAEEPQPKQIRQVKYPTTTLEFELHGFVYADDTMKNSVVLVPGDDVPHHDVFVGEEVTFPKRKKAEGPQQLPVRIMVGSVEVSPGEQGVFLMPSPKPKYLRLYWVEALLPNNKYDETIYQLPSFGRADGQSIFLADNRQLTAQFYMPVLDDRKFALKWPSSVFMSVESRAAAIKTPEFRALYESRDKIPESETPRAYRKK